MPAPLKKALILNSLALLLLAGFLTVWSLLRFSAEQKIDLGEWTQGAEVLFDEPVTFKEQNILQRNGRDAVVFFPGSEAQIHWDGASESLEIDLLAGQLLAASEAGDFQVEVRTAFARMEAFKGTFLASLEEEELQVYALNHPLDIVFEADGQDLNALSVPTGNRMKVRASSVDETVGKLRLTKLSKEFPVFIIKEEDLSQEVREAAEALKQNYVALAVQMEGDLQRRAADLPKDNLVQKMQELGQGFRSGVTLFPHARQKMRLAQQEGLLNYALGAMLRGDEVETADLLASWKALKPSKEVAEEWVRELFFVLPGGELYPLKQMALELALEEGDQLTHLQGLFNEMESLLQASRSQDALDAYTHYAEVFEAAFRQGIFDEKKDLSALSRLYVLLEGFLRQNEIFYSETSTNLLSKMEEQILILTGTDQDASEERQAFVQSKIRFLNNLLNYAANKRVPAQVAGDLGSQLLFEARQHLNKISVQTAVTNYFKTEIEKLDVAVKYLNSPEFGLASTFEAGLAEFEAKQADLAELNKYLQELRGGLPEAPDSEVPLEDALFEVRSVLSRAGILFKEVTSLGDAGHRLFKISGGTIKELSFEASFDRESSILYDISVESLNFSSGVKLENFYEVVEAALLEQGGGEDAADALEPVKDANSSTAEKVALDFIAQEFEEVGLDVEAFEFSILDLDQNLFAFSGTVDQNIKIKGSFEGNTKLVSDLVWEVEGKRHSLADLLLSKLKSRVLAAYEDLE